MEGWRDGRIKEWTDGGMEGYKNGGMEEWKDGAGDPAQPAQQALRDPSPEDSAPVPSN